MVSGCSCSSVQACQFAISYPCLPPWYGSHVLWDPRSLGSSVLICLPPTCLQNVWLSPAVWIIFWHWRLWLLTHWGGDPAPLWMHLIIVCPPTVASCRTKSAAGMTECPDTWTSRRPQVRSTPDNPECPVLWRSLRNACSTRLFWPILKCWTRSHIYIGSLVRRQRPSGRHIKLNVGHRHLQEDICYPQN